MPNANGLGFSRRVYELAGVIEDSARDLSPCRIAGGKEIGLALDAIAKAALALLPDRQGRRAAQYPFGRYRCGVDHAGAST